MAGQVGSGGRWMEQCGSVNGMHRQDRLVRFAALVLVGDWLYAASTRVAAVRDYQLVR